MPGQFKCNSCGGTYPDTTKGGIAYFHACPTQRIRTYAVCDPITGVITVPAVFEPTPNPRNENTLPNPVAGQPPIMISAGSGVISV